MDASWQRIWCVTPGGAMPRGERPMFAETFYRPLRRIATLVHPATGRKATIRAPAPPWAGKPD